MIGRPEDERTGNTTQATNPHGNGEVLAINDYDPSQSPESDAVAFELEPWETITSDFISVTLGFIINKLNLVTADEWLGIKHLDTFIASNVHQILQDIIGHLAEQRYWNTQASKVTFSWSIYNVGCPDTILDIRKNKNFYSLGTLKEVAEAALAKLGTTRTAQTTAFYQLIKKLCTPPLPTSDTIITELTALLKLTEYVEEREGEKGKITTIKNSLTTFEDIYKICSRDAIDFYPFAHHLIADRITPKINKPHKLTRKEFEDQANAFCAAKNIDPAVTTNDGKGETPACVVLPPPGPGH